ncbi:MAG TPA: EpsG family protein, partial [Geobacteraceae bacterium]
VSLISRGSVTALALVITYLIYLPYAVAVERLMGRLRLRDGLAMSCLVFALIAGLTFTQSLHLVRQYLAGTVLFLVYLWILEGQTLKVILGFTVGVLLHNSFLIPGGLLLVSGFLWKSNTVRRHVFGVVFGLLLLSFVAGTFISQWVLDSIFALGAMKDDGGLSSVIFLIDVGLFLAAMGWLWVKRRVDGTMEKETAIAVLFLTLFGGLLAGARDLTLFLLRFYFYTEWFRVIGLVALGRFASRGSLKPLIPWLIALVSLILLHLRIERSPWDYGGGLLDHLMGSMPWWVHRVNQALWSTF